MELEVGFWIKQGIGLRLFRPWDWGEFVSKRKHFLFDPFEVFRVVGFKKKLTMGDEHLVEGIEEGGLDESAFVVADFWPGVGTEQVEPGNGMGAE